MSRDWQIQEAKQKLSEVIRLATTEGPQRLTFRGKPNAWIVSDEDYLKLYSQQESLVDFFQRSPCRDLEIPIERKKDRPRRIKL